MLVETIRHIAPSFQVKTQFACEFFIFVCVARIFDRRPSDTLEAGKLRARVSSVKSGVVPRRRESIDSFATAFANRSRTNQQRYSFFVFPSDTRVSFSSQENFLFAMKNKIYFFLVDFGSDF